jgi:hypothetical protein
MMGLFKFISSRRTEVNGANDGGKQRGKHNQVPWIDDPMKGAGHGDTIVFHQRHEADTIELFFDLFFVANLATFTACMYP